MTIHIITVHRLSDFWIKPQIDFLKRNLTQPYKIWTVLDDYKKYHQLYDHVWDYSVLLSKNKKLQKSEGRIEHGILLNFLDSEVLLHADPNDQILFLDQDAFPIANIDHYFEQLQEHKIIAVQRKENFETCPHACFMITTVEFWKRCKEEFNFSWENSGISLGNQLSKTLEDKQINWKPLHRTNTFNLDVVYYGIYDDHVYHHGAGARKLKKAVAGSSINLSKNHTDVKEQILTNPTFFLQFQNIHQ